MKTPRTLQEAVIYFSDPQQAFDYAVNLRWPDGKVACPRCGSESNYFIKTRRIWLCRGCDKQFTVKVNTIFEDSPIGLDKWMAAFWMLINCKNGISSMEIHRMLGVTQKTAWFMLQRLRTALGTKRGFGAKTKLGGGSGSEVEADETYIGGKVQNMHKERRERLQSQGGFFGGKTPVQGIFDREARQVRAHVIPDIKRETLQNAVLNNVKYGSTVYTDDAVGYDKLHYRFVHDVVNHAETYVKGRVHTNSLENFWSLLKRGLRGTYVAVEPFHLTKYIDEQVFRFNTRATKDNPLSDSDRFRLAMGQVAGRRLTYADLTGKNESPRHVPMGTGETPQVPF